MAAASASRLSALGRKDVLLASGELDRLTASLVRHCDRAVMVSDLEAGRHRLHAHFGGPLLFGRLWERLGIAAVLGELLQNRSFEFAVERAVFASVLHRLFVSGSDRSCEKWMDHRDRGAAAAPPLPGNGVARRGDRCCRRRRRRTTNWSCP